MNQQITTKDAVAAQQAEVAFSATPLNPAAINATRVAPIIDLLSFLFLLLFQGAAVFAIVLYTPQIGEMGLVVFAIIFVWLGATLIVGVCDLFSRRTS